MARATKLGDRMGETRLMATDGFLDTTWFNRTFWSYSDRWPGYFADYVSFLPAGTDPASHPEFINPLDPDILKRVCADAGLEILAASFLSSSTRHANGRDHAGVIACKPG